MSRLVLINGVNVDLDSDDLKSVKTLEDINKLDIFSHKSILILSNKFSSSFSF